MWKPDTDRIAETVQSAPSIFNSRPWLPDPLLTPVSDDRIELRARQGVLEGEDSAGGGWLHTDDGVYADPLAREFAISCGAALFNLRLAIRVAGHDFTVWLLPDRKRGSTLLASVEIVTERIHPPTIAEQELYEAIWRRHTNRWPYTIIPAPLPIITAMEEAAAREGATLRLLHWRQARRWMRLSAQADEDLAADPDDPDIWPAEARDRYRLFLEERARLMPGVSPAGLGPAPDRDLLQIRRENRRPRTRKDFWLDGKRRFEPPRKVRLMALSTADDQLLDWLRAGQALQRAILTGTRYSVSAPYGLAAEYRAPQWYGVPARGRLLRREDLARYGLSVSFLTQPLECYDIEYPPTLENIRGAPPGRPRLFFEPRRRPWRSDQPRHWPFRWWFPELPQMVMRVGYAAVPVRQDVPDLQRQPASVMPRPPHHAQAAHARLHPDAGAGHPM